VKEEGEPGPAGVLVLELRIELFTTAQLGDTIENPIIVEDDEE